MKGKNTRQIRTDETGRKIEFFFPKHNPPVMIKARTRKEAEEKLAALDTNKEHGM